MKKLIISFLLIFGILIGNQCVAQEIVPKEIFLTTLNSVNSMKKLSNDTVLKLMDYNKGYADKVYDIIDNSKSDKDMKNAFKALSSDNENSLIKIFGKKKIYKDYVQLMEDELHPLIKKDKRLKYLY